MILVAVIDTDAESRAALAAWVETLLAAPLPDRHLLPAVSVRSFPVHEASAHGRPDVCVIGEASACGERGVERMRRAFPDALVFVRLPGPPAARLLGELGDAGADGILTGRDDPAAFVGRLVLHVRRRRDPERPGTLVLVDSGKGGVGVTSVAAGVADAAAAAGSSVALVDLDTETQDLSRFLRVRPFVSEAFGSLLAAQRAVTEEAVRQALMSTGAGHRFACLPPPPTLEGLSDVRSPVARSFFSVMKTLDAAHDLVVVDPGGLQGGALGAVYQTADRVLFVVDTDPSSVHAGVQKLRGLLSSGALDPSRLLLLANRADRHGVPFGVIRAEMVRLTGVPDSAWAAGPVPSRTDLRRWPASGHTPWSAGDRVVTTAFTAAAARLTGKGEAEFRGPATDPGRRPRALSRLRGLIWRGRAVAGKTIAADTEGSPAVPAVSLPEPPPLPSPPGPAPDAATPHAPAAPAPALRLPVFTEPRGEPKARGAVVSEARFE